ncbi:hypothetical protein CYLTODRAFT_446626 [Cylindrobasidium torrendii FP15055 ss-10]|uniref:F-box domain-containing protein n=1 Tax=Cylindrobasidium torrendii FP15055 ss-10 TaxID=1314674 RepID=A0A0D7AZU4_9AGAR|nr:hypothetical protein CYLTODRAFT_446626 [Cylindrobasidium torrendii FP15055 ss-10]
MYKWEYRTRSAFLRATMSISSLPKTTLEAASDQYQRLRDSDIQSSPAPINQQLQSPLFSVIPPEIRNVIFRLALSPCNDLDRPYPTNAFHYRPDYQYEHVSHTELLRTCKLVYAEAKGLPWTMRTHTFWCNRGPDDESLNGRYQRYDPVAYLERLQMSEGQKQTIGPVHIMAQLYWLEQTFPQICDSPILQCLRHIKITVRYSDWWYWESNEPLKLQRDWTEGLQSLSSLEEFEFEMEVIKRDKAQLMDIVKDVSTWRIPLADTDRFLVPNGDPPHEYEWMGSPYPDSAGVYYSHSTSSWVDLWDITDSLEPDVLNLPLFVVSLKWVAKSM